MINAMKRVRCSMTGALGLALLSGMVSLVYAQTACEDPNIAASLPANCQKERISASGNQRPTTAGAFRSARDH